VAGVAASLGLLAIPGVGPVVTIWWLATLVAGAVAGGATGGIIGALVESGVSRENAEIKDEAFRRGGAIVSAKVPDDEDARYTTILSNAAIK
jgi:CDP-diglyceride synthetase